MAVEISQVSRSLVRSFSYILVALLLGVVAIKPAQAHVIDAVDVNHAGDEAEILIHFDVSIQYLSDAPLKNGEVHIFITLLESDPDSTRLVPESRDSPPSDFAPHFTVSYPALDTSRVVKFDNPVKYRIVPGKDRHSISIFIPALTPKTGPQSLAAPSAHTTEDVELQAKQLMDSARKALGQGQADVAVETLNQLLNLPPNQQSQVAQELIGEAREQNGEYAKARVEYELYLKLYPDAKDVKQVQDRLAHLPAEPYAKVPPQPAQRIRADEKMIVYGSFAQNYYTGMSHTDTSTANGLGVTQDSLTSIDQSTLLTSLDLTARKRTESTDTRIVLRNDYSAYFLPNTSNDNRLNALYFEQNGRDRSYMYRLGRQSGTAGGVLGRFDGAWLGYSLSSSWRINGVLGSPVDYYSTGTDNKTFAGLSIDLTRLPEQWSGSAYFIEQHVGSVVDRKAVGLEAHYFDAFHNYLGQLDYDTLFKAVNIATFQGNWNLAAGDTYNLLLDHRKSPALEITNALPGQPSQSITTLVQSGVSVDSLRADAEALTATTNLFMVGMMHPFSSRLRVGGDFRITNTSGTEASGTMPAVPGTGSIYIYSAQAIGNNLLLENDLGLVSANYINAPTYKGQSLALTQSDTLWQRWRLDASLLLYSQNDSQSVHETRITPSLKMNYRMNESMSFDFEGGIEDTHTSSSTQDQKVRRKYFYMGYRWDFQ